MYRKIRKVKYTIRNGNKIMSITVVIILVVTILFTNIFLVAKKDHAKKEKRSNKQIKFFIE